MARGSHFELLAYSGPSPPPLIYFIIFCHIFLLSNHVYKVAIPIREVEFVHLFILYDMRGPLAHSFPFLVLPHFHEMTT